MDRRPVLGWEGRWFRAAPVDGACADGAASPRGTSGVGRPVACRLRTVLLADTHAALGFGPLVARREKVSRWESGRVVPSPTAQLAIARIHGVPEADVLRFAWPTWLMVATGSGSAQCVAAGEGSAFPLVLVVSGPAPLAHVEEALTALERPRPAPAREGHAVASESLDRVEARLKALEAQEAGSASTPGALFYAARAEHRLVSGLLGGAGYDRRAGARLLYLASRTGRLCACLSTCLGDFAGAERYGLAALRAAVAAGARRQSIVCLADLAGLHGVAGAPKDSLSVLGAARTVVRRPSSRLAVLLDSWEALALARAGEGAPGAQVLDRARRTLGAAREQLPVADGLPVRDLDDMRLRLCTGLSLLHEGRPREALEWLVPLTDARLAAGPDGPASSPFAAGVLLHAVDAQLALGELDRAAHSARYATVLAGGLPGALAGEYRRRFDPHRGEPVVRDLLGLLREQRAAARIVGVVSRAASAAGHTRHGALASGGLGGVCSGGGCPPRGGRSLRRREVRRRGRRVERYAGMPVLACPALRVMVVDDEELLRSGVSEILGVAPDLRVVGACRGGEAVEVAREQRPDVVLLDVRMPDVDGMSVLRGLRALPRPPQVAMLTTFDTDEYLGEALRRGAAGFLLKDTSPADLISAVRALGTGSGCLSVPLVRRLREQGPPMWPDPSWPRCRRASRRCWCCWRTGSPIPTSAPACI